MPESLTNDEIRYLESNRGKILNPRMDSTFKAMFTQPTKSSRIALLSFLEAMTGKKN